jgi:8-oxo-dGTP diphosphatase
MNQDIKVSVDAVIFSNDEQAGVSVLLVKRMYEPYKDCWALPGGLVNNDESLEDAARRELKEETGLTVDYLEQVYAFGEPNRDPRNRVISIAYFGMIESTSGHPLAAATDAKEAAWFPLETLPELAFDHTKILEKTLEFLTEK